MPKRKSSASDVSSSPKLPKRETPFDRSSLKLDGSWSQSASLLTFSCEDSKPSSKVIALDMDSTIITTKSGKVFAVNAGDWKLLSDNIPSILMDYFEEGYRIVIISNQAALEKNPSKAIPEFQKKVETIVKCLKIPLVGFFAIKKDVNRKPRTGMWRALELANDGIEIDKTSSIYCGDAAGREAMGGCKKDHSHADRLFAENVGLAFKTPEELWNMTNVSRSIYPLKFDPKTLQSAAIAAPNLTAPSRLTLILMVGLPASGKSTFCSKYLSDLGYEIINRDVVKDMKRCVKLADSHLSKGTSVVIDNTNVDASSRAPFIEVAKKHQACIRAYIMQTSFDHAQHNDIFRMLTCENHSPISSMVYNMMRSKYKAPCKEEGFDEIVEIPFSPILADDKRELYFQYLLEK